MSEARGGTIVPDIATIKQAVKEIQTATKKDPALAAALRRNPRRFLGDRGFPLDVQRELLSESGFASRARKVPCVRTCICTVECCYTKCRHTAFAALAET